MNIDLIKQNILIKFGTLSKCAEALGIDPSTLSRNLNHPTYKFLKRLRDIGVDIPIEKTQFLITEDRAIPLVKDIEVVYLSEYLAVKNKLEKCLEENKSLKAELYDLKKQLEERNKNG
jgi:transcriptional regulator with XRE-family HTH domain